MVGGCCGTTPEHIRPSPRPLRRHARRGRCPERRGTA
ncbi:MAG: hypothetical protein U5L98_08305 [Halomonas sp.]|nr:homocysteine S-methyltransferase family protein [Halomonas sp.]MDZ7852631.1 hypothetical protein [Halomonas sp.]